MRKTSRVLIGSLVAVAASIAIVLLLAQNRQDVDRLVVPTPTPGPTTVNVRPPVVLDQPPVVVREREKPITTTKTAPETVVTRMEQSPAKDSANLGRVKLIQPTAAERAELEAKLDQYLKNQADAQAAKNPR